MATGTGKTLTAAAVIKLFLRSGNARRVLFLVDRLELEDQAKKAFAALLSADFQTVIYKENRDDWRRAEIVVTTVQSLLFNNKYQRLFSPTDFDLVISDEAHRSIGGNARAVFDYFIGYKLGLTATPRDYLRRFDSSNPGTRGQGRGDATLHLRTDHTRSCRRAFGQSGRVGFGSIRHCHEPRFHHALSQCQQCQRQNSKNERRTSMIFGQQRGDQCPWRLLPNGCLWPKMQTA